MAVSRSIFYDVCKQIVVFIPTPCCCCRSVTFQRFNHNFIFFRFTIFPFSPSRFAARFGNHIRHRQAEINKEILKTIGKRGNSIDYNDIEEYLRNRYYDTARLYAPSYQPKDVHEMPAHEKSTIAVQSTKLNEKNANEHKVSGDAAMNDPSQEQVYLIDDSSNNINDDDNDTQLKYIYSLYKNRLSNNF